MCLAELDVEARSSGCGSLRRECYAGLITLRVPYYVSSCHFQLEPPHFSGGPWHSSHYCFDWGLIVTRLNPGESGEQGKRCSAAGGARIICLRLALVKVGMKGICQSLRGGRGLFPTDLFTLNHASNLILVSSFELM